MTGDELKSVLENATLTCKDAEVAQSRDAGLPLLPSQDPEAAQVPRPFSLELPPGTASVNEVRQYIIDTLVVKHNTTSEYARSVALRWHLGRGFFLHNIPLARFSEIFGNDVGPHLAINVMGAKQRQASQKSDKMWAAWADTVAARNAKVICITGLFASFVVYYTTVSGTSSVHLIPPRQS
ncbi:hypothetical protein V2A60_000765 [Cordyceps javanica]|uniref:Uncharacterized protein n=1 Tax=Cordyceps javanica TaxID=43265 RepID=A0A545VZR6_9HYPO|nr:hypothetical protein IF1G_05411 [Cordyceps javanica]TQW07218.1 hypothetical protein IF2G_05602 [Cordyceps javanica]